jgi:hypothetical protein
MNGVVFSTLVNCDDVFLVKGLKKAKAELALGIMGYNLKRVLNILGVAAVLQALQPLPS